MGSQISYFTTQAVTLITCALLTYFTLVVCQPAQKQAESFPCGAKNLMCERWGYVACLYRDEEYLCLPCSHEYLRTLCGTKEEIQGCNRFCLDVALEKERRKMHLTSNRTLSELLANYSKKSAKELLELKTQNERIEKETKAQMNRTKLLEVRLVKGKENIEQKEIHIIALTIALGVAVLVIGTLLILLKRNCNTKKSCNESGIPEIEHLMLAVRKTPECKDTFVQTDDVTNAHNGKEEKATQTEDKSQDHFKADDNCLRCPGKKMLQNITPIDNDAHGKMAIQGKEHKFPNH